MANIRNSITLQDRMTPVFRSIIRSMDSTMRVMKRLDQQANRGVQSKAYQRAERDIKQANNALIKMTNQLSKADQSAQKLSGSTSKISSSMSGLGSKGFNLTNLASALYLLKNISSTLSGILETPDTLNAISYRLGNYDTTNATGDQLLNKVYQTALDSRSDLTSTGNLASRILISGATGYNGASSIDLAGTMNKASFLGGSSPGESQRALLQLSQALSSGFLQGDELRAMREQAPGLMDVLAKGLDKLAEAGQLPANFKDVTMGQLKALGSEGELTAERVVKAFQAMKDEVDRDFENAPKQFGQAMTQVKTVWEYFLKLLSQGDGALAKINQEAWKFADWLASEDGWDTLSDLATILSIIADVGVTAFKLLGQAILWLRDHSEVLIAAFIVLGITATTAAYQALVAWVTACWPVLLFVAVIALALYALNQLGYTTSQIVGVVVGVIYFLVIALYDAVIIIVEAVWATIGILWDAGVAISVGLQMLGGVMAGAFYASVISVEQNVLAMGNFVLGILSKIAGAIDAIFGSNLAGSVNGWVGTLNSKVGALIDKNEGKLKDSLDMKKYIDNAEWFNFNAIADWRESKGLDLQSPVGAYKYGAGLGSSWAEKIGNFDLYDQISSIGNSLGGMAANGVPVNGGKLGSVGSVGSDVNIAEEDLKLLRDIAAKEFLIQMASLTPQVNVSFGDVRETADVHAIMGVIETMAEEALATSLVGA